jgi:hypothetical protein
MDPHLSVKQRQAEIQAKKEKLAELKRQRELRRKEFSSARQSIGDSSDVRRLCSSVFLSTLTVYTASCANAESRRDAKGARYSHLEPRW